MTEATPFLRKYDITFLCPPTIPGRTSLALRGILLLSLCVFAFSGGAVLSVGKGGSLCGLIDGKQEFCRDAERLHGGKLLLILCACFVIIGRHEKQRLHVLV